MTVPKVDVDLNQIPPVSSTMASWEIPQKNRGSMGKESIGICSIAM